MTDPTGNFQFYPIGMLIESQRALATQLVENQREMSRMNERMAEDRVEKARLTEAMVGLSRSISQTDAEAEDREREMASMEKRIRILEDFKLKVIAYAVAGSVLTQVLWNLFEYLRKAGGTI